jgi:hypothetical protein
MQPFRFLRRFHQPRRDYTTEATALFLGFVKRHGLSYQVADAPVEVLWRLPAQDGLAIPIALGLQNNDELNFGVLDFWSYFFPFPTVSAKFEAILDAWVEGRARIECSSILSRRRLQVLVDHEWTTIYTARSLEKSRHTSKFLQNKRTTAFGKHRS